MNIQDAARYSGKSEKTLRRWIRDAVLPAVLIQGRYDIKMSDLDAVCTVPTPDTLSDRIRALEHRVQLLEATVEGLSNYPSLTQKHAPRLLHEHSVPSESSTLPDGYVPIVDLIKQYSAPETSVMRHMRPFLKRGHWKTSDGRTVNNCLDPEGVEEFERRYVRETR